jgi:hypothetical protein
MTTTPHQRRVRENEARRLVVSDLDALIRRSPGTVPAADVLAVFERASSSLPEDSKLLVTFNGLAQRLRRQGSGRIAESGLRQVIARLRREADDLARQLEERDARLSAKHNR